MVKPFLVCLILGGLPGWAEDRLSPAAPPESSRIALYTHFDSTPPDDLLEAIHDELESIMSPMDLTFDWRSLDGVRGNEVSVELAVINFKGHCETDGLFPSRFSPGALGWTHVSDGTILPFADIDCDRIRGFVQKDLQTMPSARRPATMGRALARVLAHELYHIFAETSRHGTCGLAKEAFTIQELLGEEFHFQSRESTALRTSKVHAALRSASRSEPANKAGAMD